MPTSEMTRSDLIRAMIEVGTLLTGPEPFEDQMAGLCEATASALGADLVAIMILDGDDYRGSFQYGLPREYAEVFDRYRVERSKSIVADIEDCDSYLLFNQDEAKSRLGGAVDVVGMATAILVPFTHSDGDPLGYAIVAYKANKPEVTTAEGDLAMGLAKLAQTTILRHFETQRRREVSQAMLQVADSERRRLSRDIHDDPLQQILALRIGLEGFREQLSGANQTRVDDLVEQCHRASNSLRDVMLRTHPQASELADLEEVLESLVLSERLGQSLFLNFYDQRSEASPSYLVPTLNRVAEQAARNTIHHAEATLLDVELRDHESGTLLRISDDGIGFDPQAVPNTRLGLVSMRERTEILGGTFEIESSNEKGTVITAWFPHNDPDPEDV